jgi:hypothetical protein
MKIRSDKNMKELVEFLFYGALITCNESMLEQILLFKPTHTFSLALNTSQLSDAL